MHRQPPDIARPAIPSPLSRERSYQVSRSASPERSPRSLLRLPSRIPLHPGCGTDGLRRRQSKAQIFNDRVLRDLGASPEQMADVSALSAARRAAVRVTGLLQEWEDARKAGSTQPQREELVLLGKRLLRSLHIWRHIRPPGALPRLDPDAVGLHIGRELVALTAATAAPPEVGVAEDTTESTHAGEDKQVVTPKGLKAKKHKGKHKKGGKEGNTLEPLPEPRTRDTPEVAHVAPPPEPSPEDTPPPSAGQQELEPHSTMPMAMHPPALHPLSPSIPSGGDLREHLSRQDTDISSKVRRTSGGHPFMSDNVMFVSFSDSASPSVKGGFPECSWVRTPGNSSPLLPVGHGVPHQTSSIIASPLTTSAAEEGLCRTGSLGGRRQSLSSRRLSVPRVKKARKSGGPELYDTGTLRREAGARRIQAWWRMSPGEEEGEE
eukprot:Hpha_TRINITY_DN2465_c0_g1::TRINITY_DN2465_c0_g1_i1::g.24635::m.24635